MNYGQCQAVKVLAGERLGYSMSTADYARTILEGKALHPMFSASMSREATDFHNRLRTQPEQMTKANEHVTAIIREYGLTV